MAKRKIKKVLIIGSGAIRIGQAGEFDYSGSQAIKALKEEGIKTILVNPNIATIQTSDFLADRVYFLPINTYFVEKVIKREKPDGVLLGFGGQTALNVGIELARKGIFKKQKVTILGTSIEAIMNTEDRGLFAKKIKEMHLLLPESKAVKNVQAAEKEAAKIGYPVMCRIAYALGGLGSGVAYGKSELLTIAEKAFSFTKQVLIEKYYGGWKEL
ncbi:MAG: carbamoyl phosphate synthase large subunit, partial [Candidatus Cloacimonadota bacterium]